jgi:hypothetical protein
VQELERESGPSAFRTTSPAGSPKGPFVPALPCRQGPRQGVSSTWCTAIVVLNLAGHAAAQFLERHQVGLSCYTNDPAMVTEGSWFEGEVDKRQ